MARKRAARRLGVPFGLGRHFSLPSSIVIKGKQYPFETEGDVGTAEVFMEVLIDDCYGLQAMAASGKPVNTILDIGANVGMASVALRCAFPTATLHAYEPNPALAPFLAVQAASAGFVPYSEAVGATAGHVSLELAPYSKHTITRLNTGSIGQGDVPQVAFATAVERLGGQVDLVKMDCQGAEWDILQVADVWAGVQRVVMEYHLQKPGQTPEKASGHLVDMGFAVTKVEPADNPNIGLVHAYRP